MSGTTCSYCDTTFHVGYRVPTPLPTGAIRHLGRETVGDQAYLIHGRLGRGAHSDVYLARKDAPLTEMVIIKVARNDEGPLQREWQVLSQLHRRRDFLTSLLPVPVRQAPGRTVYRWRPGFHFTCEDARSAYPAGVDPGATVWMWNRLLEQLTVLHRRGYRHGALQPQHLLLHPRDHGLVLCGWSRCGLGEAAEDLRDSGACISYLLGSAAPKPLRDLARHADAFADAAELKLELKRVSTQVFGPPRYRPFTIPK